MVIKFNKASTPASTTEPASPAGKLAASLKDQIAAARREREHRAANPAHAARDLLRGTGITKRVGERAANEFKRTQERVQRDDPTDYAREMAAITNLPQHLIDPSITLDPSQAAAVESLIHQQFGCLIGKPGTGKSTTIRFLLARLQEMIPEFSVAFCSFTSRAVQQIRRQLPLEYHANCDTIHGLLEFAPEMVEDEDVNGDWRVRKLFVPHRHAHNPLRQKVIIVDEGGMCPIDLWNMLFDALPADTRVYLIGDIYQLPPVHGHSVLGFAMLSWPTFELSRIHRTDNNYIIDGAWDIMNGENVDRFIKKFKEPNGSIALKEIADGSVTAYQQILAVIQRLAENNVYDPLRDAIITPQNRDQLGQETINERLCAYFNQPRKTEGGLILNPRTIITAGYNHLSFAIGDKIMVTKNDREQGLTNGMIGVIESIAPNAAFRGESVGDMAGAHLTEDVDIDMDDFHNTITELTRTETKTTEEEEARLQQASHIVTVKFQNVETPITFSTAGAINTLQHAYAFTCHKAQGGEFPVVIIICHASQTNMLSREWLYTAWTRAKGKIVLLYNRRGLQKALNAQVIKGQTLEDKARAFIKIQQRNAIGDTNAKVPVLPSPVVLD